MIKTILTIYVFGMNFVLMRIFITEWAEHFYTSGPDILSRIILWPLYFTRWLGRLIDVTIHNLKE